ncbi:MAG: Uma2 family endonuclease [Planctomycetes bacterium]|nr:Uma2 family endonuclease [Planctomycetota bacterium]
MLKARPNKPYLRWTPRKIKTASGRQRSVPAHMTLAEFEQYPWPQGQRWELIWGTPVMTPAPQPPHQSLMLKVAAFLLHELRSRPNMRVLPGVDVLLPDADSYVCPDISVVELNKSESATQGPLKLVPALVVENLSPSTAANDMGAKLQAYAEAGVPEYWIVNPANGALAMFIDPKDGQFTEVVADKDGYIRSVLLGKRIRVRREGLDFDIQTPGR